MSSCGTLEVLTNGLIDTLGKDSLLAGEISRRLSFERRIDILSRLALDRTTLPRAEVKSFCKLLQSVAKKRNKIAHNPILCENDGANPHVLVIRDLSEAGSTQLNEEDLKIIFKETREAVTRVKTWIHVIGTPRFKIESGTANKRAEGKPRSLR